MLVLIGASASGKTEIAKNLIETYNFEKMVTTTTRQKRDKEINHVDYHFISKKKFLKKKRLNEFLETTTYNDEYYGTPKKGTDLNKVLIVDPKGANSLYKKNLEKIVFILLKTDEDIRKERMMDRGDNLIQIADRLNHDTNYFEMKNLIHVDYIVDTSDLTIEELAEKVYTLYYYHVYNNNQTNIFDFIKKH
ncbi:MAG: AAA family ATPase [Candidatus Izimaplasma sp.]|nr:AAA family ATPase [Candidatus Izimaplasma bacterium]